MLEFLRKRVSLFLCRPREEDAEVFFEVRKFFQKGGEARRPSGECQKKGRRDAVGCGVKSPPT